MKVRNLLFIVYILLNIATTANAKDTYSFSGLNWRDSISTVNNKLKASGGGLNTTNILGCMARQALSDSCSASFQAEGLISGSAYFGSNGLSSVILIVKDKVNTKKILIRKYGPPRSTQEGLLWVANTGESLQFRDTFVIYTSPDSIREKANQQAKEDSRF